MRDKTLREEVNKEVKQLRYDSKSERLSKCKRNLPNYLYKYRSFNHSKINDIFKMIENDYMFLSSVNDFEDKDDCKITFDEGTDIFNVTTQIYNSYFTEGKLKVYCMSKYKYAKRLAKEYFLNCGFIIEYNFEDYCEDVEIHEIEYYEDVLSSIQLDTKGQENCIKKTFKQLREVSNKNLYDSDAASKKKDIIGKFVNYNIRKFLKY